MKPWIVVSVLVAAAALGGCKRKDGEEPWGSFGGVGQRGRYLGVGIYKPEGAWNRLTAAQAAQQDGTARTVNDQAVIVVVDSSTGEVRACGDLSGVCVGMNPWKKDLARTQVAPVALAPEAEVRAAPSDDAAKTHPSAAAPSK